MATHVLLEGEDDLLLQPKCVAVKGKCVMATYVYQPSAGVPSQPGLAPHVQVEGRPCEDGAETVTGLPAGQDPLDLGTDPDPATHADMSSASAGSSFLQSISGALPRGGPGGSGHTELQPRGAGVGGGGSSHTEHQFWASMDGQPGGSGGGSGGPGSDRTSLPLGLTAVASGSPGSTGTPWMAVAAAAGGPGCPMGFQQLVGQIVRAKSKLLSRSPSKYMDRTSMSSMPRTVSTVMHGKGDGIFRSAMGQQFTPAAQQMSCR